MFYISTLVFVVFPFFANLKDTSVTVCIDVIYPYRKRHLCYGVYWCNIPLPMLDPALMFVLLSYLHDVNSNLCVCVSEHTYACPSSSIFVHTYRHIHMYCLCYVLYFYLCFCLLFSFPEPYRHLRHGVYWYNHTPTYILTWCLLFFHFVILTSTIVRSLCLPESS